MIEALKEEVKNSLEEMEEKKNKKLDEFNNSLRENQEKSTKQVKEMVQGLKPEIEEM